MPKCLHEGLVELFRSWPMLAAWLLRHVFDEQVPSHQFARAEPCDFTDMGPQEFRGDVAVALYGRDGRAVVGIDIEVQLGTDKSRRWSWPVYVATLRKRLQCPTYLLVVAPKPEVAAWCRKPIELGHPGLVLRPLVLGPDRIPRVTDPDEAVAAPERAILSAIAHGEDPEADEVFSALLAGLHETDDEQCRMYYDVVASALSLAARRRLEEIMATTKEYQSDFARKYFAEGEATSLLTVLDARGIAVPKAVEDRILACRDLDQLQHWLRRALSVNTVDELFE